MNEKKLKSILSLLGSAVLLLGLLAGCAASGAASGTSAPSVPGPTAQKQGDTQTITDMLGRQVTLKKNIERAVAVEGCCPVPGLLSMLGCADKLVSGLCYDFSLQLKISPEYKALVDKTIKQKDKTVNYEELLAQKADVILLYNITNADELASLGLPVVCLTYSSWTDFQKMLTLLGQIFGKEDKAGAYLSYADALFKDMDQTLKDISADRMATVMMSTSVEPLTVKGLKSHNQSMFERSHAISIATALNLDTYSAEVSMEDLIKANADYYILSGFLDKQYKDMQTNPDWQKLSAIKNGRLYITPVGLFPWDRPGVELPLLALWQAHIFYPDKITTDYMHDKISDFYKTFFNYSLTDDDYAALMTYEHT
jgi:iron complex transport system substrate-binding protein